MKTRFFKAKVNVNVNKYSKSLRLFTGEVTIDLEEHDINYDEYVGPLMSYYSGSNLLLETALQVSEIVRKGEYIMGIFGGEKKKGAQKYAGLVLTDIKLNRSTGEYIIKLYGIDQHIYIPLYLLKKYRCDIYKLIYRGQLHPFCILDLYNIILSRLGGKALKDFLKDVLEIDDNQRRINPINKEKIERLREELIQPSRIKPLIAGNYYVIYRCQGTFSAAVFVPDKNNYIAESHLAYINCGKSAEKAYYYAAALNYLAYYKAIRLGGGFARDQFARPIYALINAELTWRYFREREPEVLQQIIGLSGKLHVTAPKIVGKKNYARERDVFKDLEKLSEFKKLVSLFDSYIEKHVGKKRLEEALLWVSQ